VELLVFEREGEGVGLEDKVERVDVGRLDLEFGADAEGGGAFPKMGPGEEVVVVVAGPDDFGVGGDVEMEAVDAEVGAVARTHVKQVGGEGDLAVVFVAREVGDFELHSKGECAGKEEGAVLV